MVTRVMQPVGFSPLFVLLGSGLCECESLSIGVGELWGNNKIVHITMVGCTVSAIVKADLRVDYMSSAS